MQYNCNSTSTVAILLQYPCGLLQYNNIEIVKVSSIVTPTMMVDFSTKSNTMELILWLFNTQQCTTYTVFRKYNTMETSYICTKIQLKLSPTCFLYLTFGFCIYSKSFKKIHILQGMTIACHVIFTPQSVK